MTKTIEPITTLRPVPTFHAERVLPKEFRHIDDLDVHCVHDKVAFLWNLSRRDRETLLMLCYWWKNRKDQWQVEEKLTKEKWAAEALASWRETQVVALRKHVERLECALHHIAKTLWWPTIRRIARKALQHRG